MKMFVPKSVLRHSISCFLEMNVDSTCVGGCQAFWVLIMRQFVENFTKAFEKT